MGNSAFIYDAIRTPRSKGKRDGTLHEVKPIDLGAGLLRELKNRLRQNYKQQHGLSNPGWPFSQTKAPAASWGASAGLAKS